MARIVTRASWLDRNEAMSTKYLWTCCLLLLIGLPAAAHQTGKDAKETKAAAQTKQAPKAADKKAQEKKTGDKSKAPKETDDEKPAAPPKEPHAPLLIVTPGYANTDMRGSFAHKFLQYATPPQGFFLKELRYNPQIGHNEGYGLL